ncbi:hypothetical protein ScPMuIL_017010 [Solemya velum]
MVNFCAMMGCSNRSDRDKKSFSRLPTIITSQGEQTKQLSEKRQQAWLTAISRKDLTEKSYPHTRVCQDHFISGHASKLYDTNNPDWAPSLLLGYGTSSPTTPASQKSRYERSIIRSGKKQLYSTATTLIDFHNQTIAEHHAENCSDSGISCQTDMGGVDIDEREKYITVLNTEIQNLRTEVMDLRNKITNFSLSPDSFQNNEEKVKFYTGLPNFLTLMAIFDLIKDHLNDSSRSMLTPFQQMMGQGWGSVSCTMMHRVLILLFLFTFEFTNTHSRRTNWRQRLLQEYDRIEKGLYKLARNDKEVKHAIESLLHKQSEIINTAIDCGAPPDLRNARVEFNSTTVGNNATYTCKKEIGVPISQDVTCQDDGTWTPHKLDCLAETDCGAPPELKNARVEFSSTTVGNNATYTCKIEIGVPISQDVMCQDDGTWTPNKLDCLAETDCGAPPELKYTRVEFNSTKAGNNATYTCKIEIGVPISQDVMCQDDGTWSSHQLNCLRKADLLLGCYVDSSDRDLDGDFINIDLNTPEFCINYCLKQGFPYAAVQYTTECHCGESFGKHGKAEETDCNLACSGDPKELCGGRWRQRVYSTAETDCGAPPELKNARVEFNSTKAGNNATYTCKIEIGVPISQDVMCQDDGTWSSHQLNCLRKADLLLGCYVDSSDRDLDGDFINIDLNTPEFCINYCLKQGFPYAAVQYTTECHCGESFGKHGKAEETDCNLACSGDPKELCGGRWRQRVYSTEVNCGPPPEVQNARVSHASYTPGSNATYTCNIQVGATTSRNTVCQDNGTWTTADLYCVDRNELFMGCYIDRRDRDLDGGFTASNKNTPEFCINYCLQAGFRYAAVQYTTECYCGDTYGKHGQAPEKECNRPCPGDPEEICGGSWRQRVYYTRLND